jgi:multimeric flavodoxin WrbA
MKAIAISGSPRKNGNTVIFAGHALKAIAEEGIQTELVSLAGLDIKPCNACMACVKEESCPIEDDMLLLYRKMKEADAIILASPVYFGSATATIKALMDRAGYVSYHNGRVFAGKVGGAMVVARRAGKNFTFAQLTLWFQIQGFYIPGSTYWNVGIGRNIGEVEDDDEGMRTAWNFGKNIAFLLNKLKA